MGSPYDRRVADSGNGSSADSPGHGGESLVTVLVALAANTLIAIAKSVAAVITGSAALVAEASHSWADAGNEIFLLIADRRSRKAPDAGHPLGYGREAYVWSMIAAFGVFAVGATVSVWHGVQELISPSGEAADYLVGYLVLAIAFVLEGTSFLQALRQTRTAARRAGLRPLRLVEHTSDPTLRAVFVEDAAALIGLMIAAAGMAMHELTGNAAFDAIASVLVGLLLAVIAIFLIRRNRDFLTGEVVSPDVRRAVLTALLETPDIETVSELHLEYVGPGRVFLVAAVDLAGDAAEHTVAERHQRIEDRLQAHPGIQRALLTMSAPGAGALTPGG